MIEHTWIEDGAPCRLPDVMDHLFPIRDIRRGFQLEVPDQGFLPEPTDLFVTW